MGDSKSEKGVLGFPVKTWTKIVLISVSILLVIFIVIPFILAMIMPIVESDDSKYTPLVSLIDGMALLVGLLGTIASLLSIGMTFYDRKRYEQEKKQTEQLFASVDSLHKEITNVDNFVKKTFEQNQRLGLQLYECQVISINPNLEVDVSTGEGVANDRPWTSGGSGEIKE